MKDHSILSKAFSKSILRIMHPFPTLHSGKIRKEFLENQGIVRGPSIGEKASLIRTNDALKNGFDPIHNGFSKQLVGGVIEAYRSEVS